MGKTERHNWVIIRNGEERLPFVNINALNVNFTCAPIFESRQAARNFLKGLGGKEGEDLRIRKIHRIVVE